MSTEDATDIILTTANSTEWRAKANHKHITRVETAAKYKVPWGDQAFDGPHMLVHDEGGNYGIELEAFHATHEQVPGLADRYIKVALVLARQVTCETLLRTKVKGKEESSTTIPVGGWIVQNPTGERYCNVDGEFQERYARVQ